MLGGEDDTVMADSQSPVITASQCCDLPSERCRVLGILLNLGNDPLPVLRGEAAHISYGPSPPFDLHSLVHTLYFLIERTDRQGGLGAATIVTFPPVGG